MAYTHIMVPVDLSHYSQHTVLMALSVVDGINQGYTDLLKEVTEAEPSRVTRPAMRYEVS